MSQEFNVHIAGIALHLSLLDDQENIPSSGEGRYIGELISASGAFSLNSVPTISVSVPHGVRVEEQALKDSYVYGSLLKKAIKERQGVGVYIDYIGEEDVWGLPPRNCCSCIFKGYILEQSVQNSKDGGVSQFTIVHWLSDLTNIAIVNRLSSPDNPVDISNDAVFEQYDKNSGTPKSAWIPGSAYVEALKDKSNTIFDALKLGLEDTMKEGQKVAFEQPGSLKDEPFYRKAVSALNAIEGFSLDFNSDMELTRALREAISISLSTDQRSNYLSTTLWQKLVQTFLPQYYLALVPCVDKAYIIPQPGIRITSDICFPVEDANITSLSTRTKHGRALGGVFLSARVQWQESALIKIPSYATKFQYPKEKANPGIMKACTLPAWLECYHLMTTRLQDSRANWETFAKPSISQDDVTTETLESEGSYAKLCQLFTKTVYHAEVTRGNVATLDTPLCLTIPPGMPIKVHVPKDKLSKAEDEYICGIVEKIQYTIASKSMNTVFQLSDLRVGDQIEKFALDNALLYKDAMHYNNGSSLHLYIFSKDLINADRRIEEAKCERNL